MSKKSVLKEAAQKMVDAGQLNPAAVKDVVALAKRRVEKLMGVDGAEPTYLFTDKSGGSLNIEMGLAQMVAKRDYLQPQAAHDKSKPLDRSSNPFIGLRDKSGAIRPEQMKKVESLLKAVGTAKAAAIAKSAGLRLDGSQIPEKFL
jgi:hypothetical protein